MPELSQKVSASIRKHEGVNPLVYSALTMTMRYAAVYRHVRQENPEGFASFVKSLNKVDISPVVVTPNVLTDRPEDRKK
jgi:hypothetical protein